MSLAVLQAILPVTVYASCQSTAEEVEEKIAKKDMVGDEKAISPVEGSSAFLESETALTVQKSVPQPSQLNHTNDQKETHPLNEYDAPSDLKDKSISVAHLPTDPHSPIEAEEPIFESKAPSLIATEEEVTQFIAEYVERYNQKEIDGFLSLFSPKAIQNQRDGFKEIRRIYSDYFNKSWKLRYHLEDIKIKINQSSVETKGRYKLVQKGKRSRKEKVWRGDIHWVLIRENGALKIRYLDYTPEKSS